MSKYLPGYSYGLSGGPRPLSTRRPPREDESGPGTYTYDIWKGPKVIGQVTFDAYDLRDSQLIAKRKEEEMGGSFSSNVSFVPRKQ